MKRVDGLPKRILWSVIAAIGDVKATNEGHYSSEVTSIAHGGVSNDLHKERGHQSRPDLGSYCSSNKTHRLLMMSITTTHKLTGQHARELDPSHQLANDRSAFKVLSGVFVMSTHQSWTAFGGKLFIPNHQQDLERCWSKLDADARLHLPHLHAFVCLFLEQFTHVGLSGIGILASDQADGRVDGPARDVDKLLGIVQDLKKILPSSCGLVWTAIRMGDCIKLEQDSAVASQVAPLKQSMIHLPLGAEECLRLDTRPLDCSPWDRSKTLVCPELSPPPGSLWQ